MEPRKSSRSKLKKIPRRVLMIKGHSAGIGDILRSSATWRALKKAYPDCDLHLILLTKEPGYASESLMARHHLLKGFSVVDKRTKGMRSWKVFLARIGKIVEEIQPDLIIDFEPHGMRTSLVSLLLRLKYGIKTTGINEIPVRGLFYSVSSVSSRRFAKKRGLDFPLEYTNRDFVVLSALGIERNGTAIELDETAEGKKFRVGFRTRYGIPADIPLLGLNIGCGTPDAMHKRPDLGLLSRLIGHLQNMRGFSLVLTGASFEKDVNEQFIRIHTAGSSLPVCDLAGKTNLIELAGLIRACSFFISTDSGPYHMAVALRVPTLAIFTVDNSVHFHHEPWVRCLTMTSEKDMPQAIAAAEELLNISQHEGTAS